MIELRSVRKVFGGEDAAGHVALDGVDLTVEAGELHALIGTSGCGKTTTLRLVNRLEEPTSGEGRVDGADFGVLLQEWGPCGGSCLADFDGNDVVDGGDLGEMLLQWGDC